MKSYLKSFSIIALLFLLSCYKASEYDLVNYSDLIKEMTISPDKIPADGISFGDIKVVIPQGTDIKSVKFQSTAGTFVPQGSQVDAYLGEASIKLIAGTIIDENVIIQAEIAGIRKAIKAAFTRAYPETIQTEASVFTIKTGWANELNVSAKLKRSKGTATPGAKTAFRAVTKAGAPIGAFRNEMNESDANGQTSAVFSPGVPADGYTGEIYLIGSTLLEDGSIIADTASVNLTAP
jgi:hypothetical protein